MVELKKRNNGKLKNVANVAGNFRSVSLENASTEDGLQTYCKECGNVYARNRKKTPGGGGNLKKIYSNPELAKFSPRELIAELKARGYTGELKYTQTISL